MIVVWALILVATGVWYSFHGRPTVREQTTIATAQSTVDSAIGKVLAAAGPEPVPVLSAYHKTSDCDVTPVRAGVRYERAVQLYTTVGGEVDLLNRIAAGLPKSYHARAIGVTTRTLTADAGYYVALNGMVSEPGLVRVVAVTGCRTLGHQPPTDPSTEPADAGQLEQILGNMAGGKWSTHQLPCGVRTVEVDLSAAPLPTTVPPAADPVLSRDGVLAFHDGAQAVVIRTDPDGTTVTATAGECQ